jgi:beta-mannanase
MTVPSLETAVDDKMDMQAVFAGWEKDAFPSYMSGSVKSAGKTLVIYWEHYGTTLDNIISGKDDAIIADFAADAKAYAGNVILVPFHEMNGNWDPWDGPVGNNTPAKVISAWKHVHDKFAGIGNVKWGWAPNNVSVPNTTANKMEAYYPGDAYVDYVGVDGFNFNDGQWQTFSQVFDDSLKRLAAYKKPIYIFSMASAEGSQKAAWIKDAITVQMPKYANLKGFIWFNEDKEKDWRIESDAASVAAFKAALP